MTDTRCSICRDAIKLDWVSKCHRNGITTSRMEDMSRSEQTPVPVIKRETIAKHLKHYTPPATTLHPNARDIAVHQQQQKDVATLVQQQVIEKIEAGEARVTVQHGLQAQQMLDRRVERAKDRELSVTLARMLHAERPPQQVIEDRPLVVIEGEVNDVG